MKFKLLEELVDEYKQQFNDATFEFATEDDIFTMYVKNRGVNVYILNFSLVNDNE